jgi:uncharacterized membrane-anchored protein
MSVTLWTKQKKWAEPIHGEAVVDSKTKRLLQRIQPGQIAIVAHENIDEIAARGFIEKKVRAVINTLPTMNGMYPTVAPMLIQQAGIPIYQVDTKYFPLFREGEDIYIYQDRVGHLQYTIKAELFDDKKRDAFLHLAYENMEDELSRFIDNTLSYAQKEKKFVLKPLPIPPILTPIAGRHVVVVVRGCGYKEDLYAIRSYIDDYKPVLIGVDGGADALLEYGLKPDLIIGDMDSISDEALLTGSEIIVHGYPDGSAPGLERVQRLGVQAWVLPAPGTSEDIAMLLAFDKKAELIVTLGTHTHMIDFLEKGRKGMASTVLVRMKIGPKLIDAKGVSKLYHRKANWKTVTAIGLAAGVPIISMIFVHPGFRDLVQMLWFNLKTFVL